MVAPPSGNHFIIYEDITERLRNEENLRQSEKRFRLSAERSPVAVLITNPGQTIDYLTPKFTRTYGYDISDIPDLDSWWRKACSDPDYRQKVITNWFARVEQARQAGSEVAHVERIVRCKDGSGKMLAFYGSPVYGKTMVVPLGVTATREAANALMDSEARFRRFVEATPLGVHIYRHHGQGRQEFSGCNPAADCILGLDHAPLMGQGIEDALPALAGTSVPGTTYPGAGHHRRRVSGPVAQGAPDRERGRSLHRQTL